MNVTNSTLRYFQTNLIKLYELAYADTPVVLAPALMMPKTSTAKDNTYYFPNRRTSMRKWQGDRRAQGLAFSSYVIENEPYELTFEIDKYELEDDQLDLYGAESAMMGEAVRRHADDFCLDLLENGKSRQCYDGGVYFRADHPIDPAGGATGTFSNLLTSTALTPDNFRAAKKAMRKYNGSDNQRLGLAPTHLIVPADLEDAARNVLEADYIAETGTGTATASSTTVSNRNKGDCEIIVADRLTSATTWYLVSSTPRLKPIIHQTRSPFKMVMMTDLTSEAVWKRRKFEMGVDGRDAAGYTLPQLMIRCEA